MVYLLQPIDLPLNAPADPFARWWHPAAQPYPPSGWPVSNATAHPQPWHHQRHQSAQPPQAGPSSQKPAYAAHGAQPYTQRPVYGASYPLPALYVPDQYSIPELEPPSTPSDIGSPMSTVAPPSPAPEFVHVVCNAPLLAPKPLPYRSPAFLDSFILPDIDEDLSHLPYTPSRSKRKRAREEQEQDDGGAAPAPPKRRATEAALRGIPTMLLNGLASQRRYSD